MEFGEVIKKRKMVRAYIDEPKRVRLGRVQPGLRAADDEGADELGPFWPTYQCAEIDAGPSFDPVTKAPLVVVPMSCKAVYLDRYARQNKGWTDRDEAHWPVPNWDIDTGFPV